MSANGTVANQQRWKRQMSTSYKNLTEEEKESDREWARKVIQIMLNQGIFIGKNG